MILFILKTMFSLFQFPYDLYANLVRVNYHLFCNANMTARLTHREIMQIMIFTLLNESDTDKIFSVENSSTNSYDRKIN